MSPKTKRSYGHIAAMAGLWLITCIEALGMGAAGYGKLSARPNFGAAYWEQWFTLWGYPHSFLVVVAVVEVGGALLLLVPRMAPYAALTLLTVMLGAIFTTMAHAHDALPPGLNPRDFTPVLPTIHLVLLCIVLVSRRRNLRFRPLFAAIGLLSATRAGAQAPNATASFVTTQGKDTISIEQYTRAGNTLTGVLVAHLRGTQVHDYVLTLGADGMPARYEMTYSIPGVTPAPGAFRSVSITYGRDSATYVTVTDTALKQRVAMTRAYPLLGKSVVGLELALARLHSHHTDSANIVVNLPTGPDPSHKPNTLPVTFFGPDSARIAGALVARLDRDGRLLVLHAGPAETRRVTSLDVATLVAGFVATNAQRADAEAAAVAAHVEIALPAAALEPFVGEYPLTANGVVTIPFVITRDGDKLFMRALS